MSKRITSCTLRAALLAVAVIAVMAAPALAQSVSTDRLDYSPGEIVTISGGGWAPGETVTLSIAEDPNHDGPHVLSVTAGDDGTFINSDFVTDADGTDGDVTFTLTATGQSSGLTATTTFTDPGSAVVCGDGKKQGNEQCDDGNTINGDGCSATCTIECAPSTVTTTQGGGGACVDSEWHWVINQINGTCPDPISVTFNDGTETVALGSNQGSVCSYTLTGSHLSSTWVSATATYNATCSGQFVLSHGPCAPTQVCGNGIIEGTEVCDDGNTVSGDGCSDVCLPELPLEVCGDGIVNGSDQCDDGNTNDGDACSNTCTWNPETCSIATDIHFPDHGPTGTTVTMGATVHDSATVSCVYPDGVTVAPIPASTAVFNYFTNGTCSDPAAATDAAADISSGALDPSSSHGPLSVGSVSFNALFSGGIDIHGLTVDPDTSDCEPLKVLSSITEFYYTVPNDSTHYTCTLEAKAAGAIPGVDCLEASVALNTLRNYTVHAVVGNDTGGSIMEKAQGGLAAKASYFDTFGTLYSPVLKLININPNDIISIAGSGSCGAAVIDNSSAKTGAGNTGNVVIWGNGTTATNQTGFSMAQGDSCELRVVVQKKYSSCGQQPVTSSWSETQTGPGTFFGKSPYTGQLSVNVCGQP